MLHLWYIVFTFTGDKEATVVHNRWRISSRHNFIGVIVVTKSV